MSQLQNVFAFYFAHTLSSWHFRISYADVVWHDVKVAHLANKWLSKQAT